MIRYLDLALYGAGSICFIAGTVIAVLLRAGRL